MEMKEYLNTETYEYKLANTKPDGEWVCIPEGAIEARLTPSGSINFINSDSDYMNRVTGGEWVSTHRFKHDDVGQKIIWQRPQQPEALPFIDDNPQSLNEQYAEIEEVRQAIKVKSGSDSDHAADAMSYGIMGIKQDNVNHPSHYTQGKVECLDALESATIGKSGIEAVCVANIIKYLWRYEEKNGLEDIKKANFYLNRLIATLENNNG